MAQLIFRCNQAKRVITTGIEIDRSVFESLNKARSMLCRFCGQDHAWELVEQAPDAAALMSLRAEDYLGRCLQSEARAAEAVDPDIRDLYYRMAGQWYQLAVDHEARGDALA